MRVRRLIPGLFSQTETTVVWGTYPTCRALGLGTVGGWEPEEGTA